MTEDPPPGPATAPVDADPLAAFLKLAQQEGALEGENLEAFVTGLRERADRVIAERLGRAETRLRILETENKWRTDAMLTLAASVNSLEGENAWLRERMVGLEGERSWLRQTIGALEGEKIWLRESLDSLERERVWLRETLGAFEGEKVWLRETVDNLEREKTWLRETVDNLEGERGWLRDAKATLEDEATLRNRAIDEAREERGKASAAHESLLTHHREVLARLAGQLSEIASLSPLRVREVRHRLHALADLFRAEAL